MNELKSRKTTPVSQEIQMYKTYLDYHLLVLQEKLEEKDTEGVEKQKSILRELRANLVELGHFENK